MEGVSAKQEGCAVAGRPSRVRKLVSRSERHSEDGTVSQTTEDETVPSQNVPAGSSMYA